MAETVISEQQVLDALRQVPAERWPEVLRFVKALERANSRVMPTGPPLRTFADLLNSGLVGIWADRTDITDNREFARKLRYEAEHRWEHDDAAGH